MNSADHFQLMFSQCGKEKKEGERG